jgi:NitT/TauT family transport system permease protein
MRQLVVPLIAVTLFLVSWEMLVWVNDWPNYKMASPSDLWPAFWRFKWLFLSYGWETLWRTVLGLIIAVIVGVLLGMVMGFSKVVREGLYPLLVGFNAIPKATVVPIVALLFVGHHDLNTILIAFMISFFPIAVSVSIGLSTLEPEYRDILRALGASKFTIFWKIALPKTLPEFFGALKVAVTLAFIGTNLMEIVSPHGRGLGALFDSGKTNSDYPLMFAVLIALAILGIALYYVVVFLERIFAGWAERAAD